MQEPPPKGSQKFVVFRGNGTVHLRAAFARRHSRWRNAGPPEPTAATGREGILPSKGDENLLLSKALSQGDVAFVFRDLLVGPHWVETGMPNGQKPPSASLHSAHYPAVTASGKPQVVNRWPRHASLTSKDGSLKALVEYYRCQDINPWYYVPLSFSVPNMKLLKAEPTSSPAWRCVKQAHDLVRRGLDPRVTSDQSHHNLWLLKPTNGSGGEGITIGSSLEELEEQLSNAKSSAHGFIAQKYLEEPLLYDGRKFDLRVWAVLASDPESAHGIQIYAYREGYARTSSEAFSLPSRSGGGDSDGEQSPAGGAPAPAGYVHKRWDTPLERKTVPSGGGGGGGEVRTSREEAAAMRERLVHLTNYCMQVQGDNCGSHEEGNAISFDDLDTASPGTSFRAAVLPRIHALIVDAILASRKELLHGLKEHGGGRRVVSLLGYDFMITKGGRPFLIEVNNNPLIAAQNPWHDQLVHRMIDDYITLAADYPFFEGVAPPTPRPPLDGTHCKEFDGNGFILLAGRPQENHNGGAAPMFALTNFGNTVVLQRDPMERRRAAAVDEPAPPGLPTTISSSPPKSPSPQSSRSFGRSRARTTRTARLSSPRRSNSPQAERPTKGGKALKKISAAAQALTEEQQIAAARAALYGR